MNLIPLNECQMEMIKKEDFYQTPERVEEYVTHLIEWLSRKPHLPNITDKEWLRNFIVSCKYNLQRSKKMIENYFIARAEYHEFFDPITIEELTIYLNYGNVFLLPKPISNGNRILYTIIKQATDDTKFDVLTYIKLLLAILDLQLKTESIHGNIMIFDFKHLQLYQFLQFTPKIVKNLFNCVFESFPMSLKGVHIINPPQFIGRMLQFFKMFLSNKINDRILVHDNLDDLYKHIPKDILPDICDGIYGSIVQLDKDTMDIILSNKDWLERRNKADLSKLMQKRKNLTK